MKGKSVIILIVILATLNWMELISDQTAMWLIFIVGGAMIGKIVENKFEDLEDRIHNLERKNKEF